MAHVSTLLYDLKLFIHKHKSLSDPAFRQNLKAAIAAWNEEIASHELGPIPAYAPLPIFKPCDAKALHCTAQCDKACKKDS